MKAGLLGIVALSLFVQPTSSDAAKPKRHPQQRAAEQPTPQPPPQQPLGPNDMPSSVLQPFLDQRLDIILAPLDAPGLKHPNAVIDLRSSIADALVKMSPERQQCFRAALAVCDALQQAVDERTRAIAAAQGSGAAQSSASLGVTSTQQLSLKQLHSENRAHQDVARNNAFFVNAAITQWTQRSAQLRQHIQQLYLKEREAERQVPPTTAPTVPASPAASHP